MKNERKSFSIKKKMYIFVILTVLVVALGTAAIAFLASVNQIDRYYKQNTADNARNFASMVDGDYLKELKAAAESEEFQQLREAAEAADDEAAIEEYLRSHGLWEGYYEIRSAITEYLGNMQNVKYLYVVAHGDANAEYDMYLVDDEENPLYETGYYEEREAELRGIDIAKLPEPTISNGDWGWLCSDFKPVYASDGSEVCIVGCDVGMDEVMQERTRLFIVLIIGALVFTAIVLVCAMIYINRFVVTPLKSMTAEMKRFRPAEDLGEESSGVMSLTIESHDEISEIYDGIRSMQINILNRLKEKEMAEKDIRDKEEKIDRLSIESYRDALTGVGNKAAYIREIEELNKKINKGKTIEFALVMVDMNRLKQINDDHGHKAGDQYIRGCCSMICEAFKHSPVYRIGGDEFVAVLTGKDYEHRKSLVEKLKEDYAQSYQQKEQDPWLRFSAAVGMAENASDDVTAEFVFKRADKAMYADKERFKQEYGSYR
ncbi:MAG: GGDEF domain-containing protein [Lachnospiraceae bacterium]|nr:GGDEF domain-containing protein [Lachnospiraceae bacterium]